MSTYAIYKHVNKYANIYKKSQMEWNMLWRKELNKKEAVN